MNTQTVGSAGTPVGTQDGRKVRHSPGFLEEMKGVLEKKERGYEFSLGFMKGDPDNEDDKRADDEEYAKVVYDNTLARNLSGREAKRLRECKEALLRIKNGTYGIDERDGELIPEQLMRACPTATFNCQKYKEA